MGILRSGSMDESSATAAKGPARRSKPFNPIDPAKLEELSKLKHKERFERMFAWGKKKRR